MRQAHAAMLLLCTHIQVRRWMPVCCCAAALRCAVLTRCFVLRRLPPSQSLVNCLKHSTMSEFLDGATALLEVLLTAARAAADGWSARAEWLAAMLAERSRRALPHEADAVRAADASRPLLLLAFGGAGYAPLQFVPAGGLDARGAAPAY